MVEKLSNYRQEDHIEEFNLSLLTEVKDLNVKGDKVFGELYKDVMVRLFQRGTLQVSYKTIKVPFMFKIKNNSLFLVVAEKKQVANSVANLFSNILFLTIGGIVNAEIPPEALARYQRQNSSSTKVIFFDNLNLPNLEKISLYGPSLADTNLYADYMQRGKIWYTVLTSAKNNYVVGITRDSVVTIFNKVSVEDLFAFVEEEVLQLIS
ncbi:MAG: hypothetical protein ACP5KW_00100 [Thermoproteota archaeon]